MSDTHGVSTTPLIKAQTVNATNTVTGEWFPTKHGKAFGFWAHHASATGTGDVTYYVDLLYKQNANPNNSTWTPAATDYYRVTLGNIGADNTVGQYIPDACDAPFTYIRGVAVGSAAPANPADTVANLYMTQY